MLLSTDSKSGVSKLQQTANDDFVGKYTTPSGLSVSQLRERVRRACAGHTCTCRSLECRIPCVFVILATYRNSLSLTGVCCGLQQELFCVLQEFLCRTGVCCCVLQEFFVSCRPDEKPLVLLHFLLHLKFKQILCFTNTIQAAHR